MTFDSAKSLVTSPHNSTQKVSILTQTTICNLKYQITILANSEYWPSIHTDIQEKYLKGSLARINSEALAKDHLENIQQAELQHAVSCKEIAREV